MGGGAACGCEAAVQLLGNVEVLVDGVQPMAGSFHDQV